MVPQCFESFQIPPRSAAEIEQFKRCWHVNVVQQRRDVLTDIMVFGALPKRFSAAFVMRQGEFCDVLEFF